MIILGIDPGLQKTGWGIISVNGSNLKFIGSGLAKSEATEELPLRINKIYQEIFRIVELYKPHEAAIEETFVNKNAMSSLKLGHARAAAMLAATQSGIVVKEYATKLVKKSVVGVGAAEKQQVMLMIKHLLPGSTFTTEDEADALAVAICHAGHMKRY